MTHDVNSESYPSLWEIGLRLYPEAHSQTVAYRPLHLEMPIEVMIQIFNRLPFGSKLRVREVCHYWEHIVNEMGKETLREIRATHQIAISIFNEGTEVPIYFQTRVYTEVAKAEQSKAMSFNNQITVHPETLGAIAYELVSRGCIQDALQIVNSFSDDSFKVKVLSIAIARLTMLILPEGLINLEEKEQIEKAQELEKVRKLQINELRSALQELDKKNGTTLAFNAELTALKLLLSHDEYRCAETVINWYWLSDCPTDERDEKLKGHAFLLSLSPGNEVVVTMINNMREREAQLRAQGPGQA